MDSTPECEVSIVLTASMIRAASPPEAVLERGSLDYNLHIIIFEENSKLNIMQSRSWFKNINKNNLLWIGNNFDEQYLFEYDKKFNSRLTISNGYGILISNKEVEVLKLLEEGEIDE